eukprot:12065931-Prorocentrum_lima.AAC.1
MEQRARSTASAGHETCIANISQYNKNIIVLHLWAHVSARQRGCTSCGRAAVQFVTNLASPTLCRHPKGGSSPMAPPSS